jgi:hypothetical protein
MPALSNIVLARLSPDGRARPRMRNVGLIAFATLLLVPFTASAAQAAARSMTITVNNKSHSATLHRTGMGLWHGVWAQGGGQVPPENIAPKTSVKFGAESNGFATGVEGFANYAVISQGSNIGWVHLYFDNPFVGSNAVKCSTSAPDDFVCGVANPTPPGNNAFDSIDFGVFG